MSISTTTTTMDQDLISVESTRTEKLSIQNEHGETITGILEQKDAIDVGRHQTRLVLIAHGLLGHKDYLFQRVLAEKLPYSSFRFDFRGNGESAGEPGYAKMAEGVEDLHTVAKYFENLGYEIFAVIGHSQGSVAGLKFATTVEKPLPFFVNISGRYKMNGNQIHRRPDIAQALKAHGFFDWKVKQRDRIAIAKMTQNDIDRFNNWSNEHVSRMPLSTCVLTCHGLKDTIVPPYNAAMFANKISNHTLVLVPEADHNFKGYFYEVTKIVVEFFAKHEASDYKKAIAMGQSMALVMPRWIDVNGVRNFRDVGGWPVKDGSGYIRERTVFRSGHLSNMTPEGCNKLDKLNVKATFDFRFDHEIQRDGSMQTIPGVTKFGYNLVGDVIKSQDDILKYFMTFLEGEEGFANGYMVILDSGKKLIGNVFRFMLEELSIQKRTALVIHCTAGKDRTGVFIMVLLGLCGVDEEIIAKEYELTNLGHFDDNKDLDKKASQMGVSVKSLVAAFSASYGGMKLTIQKLKEKYGSFEGYVRNACGLTHEEVCLIRDIMVVPIRFEERQLYRPKI